MSQVEVKKELERKLATVLRANRIQDQRIKLLEAIAEQARILARNNSSEAACNIREKYKLLDVLNTKPRIPDGG